MHSIGKVLEQRVAGIRKTLHTAADQIPPSVIAETNAALAQVTEKLALGVDHAVAALVGGTGSGKSSLFNAITRQSIADVGVIRPTTALATACSWSTSADPLLDFLQVVPQRRAVRVPPLTPADEDGLSGLVLLDLPDHDSIELTHAEQVDRLLPMIDLLIWVLDPQKYADNALHEKYLRALTQRHEAMLVVVNQIDRIPESSVDNIRNDVARLLAEDDLADVPIVLASAKTGSGIGMVRDHLIQVLTTESIAAQTARAEIDAIAQNLAKYMAPQTPDIPDPGRYAAELAQVAGAGAMAESIAYAVANPTRVALARVQPPAKSSVAAIREEWLAVVTEDMPAPWRDEVQEAATGGDQFYQVVADVAADLVVPEGVDRQAATMRIAGFATTALAVVLAVIAALVWQIPLAWILTGVLMLTGLGLILAARLHRRRQAQLRAQQYRDQALTQFTKVIDTQLGQPIMPTLEKHEQVISWLTKGARTF